MRFGAVFPTCEIGDDPAAIRDYAQAAEELGFDHLVVYDHVLGAVHEGRDPKLAGPYTERDAFHEPFVLFGFLAAATRRIELATGVLILPQRQTALVAKQAAEVDLLSGGRLRLGVGTGWNFVEYESLGVDYATRGPRIDEQVALLRRLWREPVVDHAGEYERVDRAGLLPLPGREIPIWFGGFTPPALRRAARTGDGFLFGAAGRGTHRLFETLRELLAEEGRDEGFGAEAIVDWSAGPDRWRRELEAWEAAGGTHFSIRTMSTAASFMGVEPSGLETPGDHVRALEAFHKAVR